MLERSITISSLDVAIKTTEPVRIAEASATAPGYGSDNLGPVFQRLAPEVIAHLQRAGVRPGVMIAWYESPADDGSIVLHAGFDIANQDVPDSHRVSVRELPSVRVASVIHRGSMEGIVPVYEALVRWIEDSGDHLDGQSRELYHYWDDADPAARITELQMLLSTKPGQHTSGVVNDV